MWIKQGSRHRKHGWFTLSHSYFNQRCPGLLNCVSYLRDQFTSCLTSSNISTEWTLLDLATRSEIQTLPLTSGLKLGKHYLSHEPTPPFAFSAIKGVLQSIALLWMSTDNLQSSTGFYRPQQKRWQSFVLRISSRTLFDQLLNPRWMKIMLNQQLH